MTARHDHHTGQPPRRMGALVAAAAIVVAVVALVLVFGIARPPELASLGEQPDAGPATAVAWIAEGDPTCVRIAEPDGTDRALLCPRDGPEIVAWDDEGVVLLGWGGQEPTLVWHDPVSGEQRREQVGQIDRPGVPDVDSRYLDGVLQVYVGDSESPFWEVDAPEAYDVVTGALSPDERHVVMVDSADRLLVAPADGSADPVVWARDAVMWQAPVWQGTPVPVEPAG